ncbi:DUF2690 domain-containing protein [Laceyella putida]|uniref:DUF2690 domain-containing protein n=1 Tax=Laceyella putida TaxID=110101 RepID=A0ABW2RI60_9BACL
MKKRWAIFAATLLTSSLLVDMAGAAEQDKPAPSKSKEPVNVEVKGDLILEYYEGPSTVKLPSEKEIFKRQGKRATAKSPQPSIQALAYDNTDPETTGCANNAITARSVLVKNKSGTVLSTTELRYSPACRTAWGRMYVKNYQSTNYGQVVLYRLEQPYPDEAPYNCPDTWPECYHWKTDTYVSPGDSNYTNQFNDAGTLSFAHGMIRTRTGGIFEATTASY